MRKTKIVTISFLIVTALNSSALALSRYECNGITKDQIVLTPYQDGTVNLSFNTGPVSSISKFTYKGDVFFAIFKIDDRGSSFLYILDNITKTGYEVGVLPDKPSYAAKITCAWLEN
jgi:hypothetical protein